MIVECKGDGQEQGKASTDESNARKASNLTPSPSPGRRGEPEMRAAMDVSGTPLLSRGWGEDIHTIVGFWVRLASRRVNAKDCFSDALLCSPVSDE